jgi:pimeloyl-ACP methyl ester carboxylesterase
VRSRHENALPLIMTHGWPGSVIELLETVGPLTDPAAHGGSAEDAFHLVLPSIPGYGFSAEPAEIGWYSGRVAQAWAELMRRLGYTRYVAQGGDQGASVTDAMGRQAPEGLTGIHTNLLVTALAGPEPAGTEKERAAADALAEFRQSGFGYFLEQATRPQTIGYALLDSPVALAGWMLDHDTDSYYKISRAFVDGQPSGGLTRDHILDNITLYWLTGTGASAARSYWEAGRAQALAGGQPPPQVSIPVGYTTFPGEIFRAPRSWVEKGYPTLSYFHEASKGGHFRRLGRAGSVLRGDPGGVQAAALTTAKLASNDDAGSVLQVEHTAEAARSDRAHPQSSSSPAPNRWRPRGRRYAIGYVGH